MEASLAPFNHHFVIRSSEVQALEGDAPKGRFVVIAFDSVAGEGARVVRLAGLCGDQANQAECSEEPRVYRRGRCYPLITCSSRPMLLSGFR